MSDLGNRTNVNAAIDLLLDDAQPNEAIQPSDHNGLLKDILDTLANGLSVTLRTGNTTSGQNIEVTSGDTIDFDNSSFLGSLTSGTLTAARTYTLPDKTGTVAMLSDVENILNTNGLILGGNYTHDLNSNNLGMFGGSIGIGDDLTVISSDATKTYLANFVSSSSNAVLTLRNIVENVGIGTNAADISAKLEISSTDKGLLIPRMSTTQRNAIGSPSESLMIYNTTDDQFEFYDSLGAWSQLGGGGASIYTADGTIGTGRVATITDSLEFAGGKINLSTTTDGMLIPRLTTAQMNAISSPDTNLLIFNTDLTALYRYNGSAWVAMSAGYGIVSTTDTAGNPTFYATVESAYSAGAGSIKLHTDYEETTSNPINIVDGRNVDLNGFTYTYNVADGTSIFEDNTSNNSIRIENGRLIRKNGTGGDHIINCNLIQTRMDVLNVYAENENGACLNIRTTFNGTGSEFASNNTSGLGFSFASGSIVSFGKYVNKSNSDSSFLGSELKFVEFICLGSGKNNIGGNVYNSRFITNTGRAILTSLSATKIYDCYLESPGSNALDIRNNSEIYNSTMVSNAAVAVNTVGATATKMKGCIVQGSHSVYSVNALSRIEDCIIVNTGTGYAIDANATTEIINNTIRLEGGTADAIDLNTYVNSLVSNNEIFVNDSSAVGIKSTNVDIFIVDNDVKGTTTAFDLGTGSNLWTATKDSQGNSAQL